MFAEGGRSDGRALLARGGFSYPEVSLRSPEQLNFLRKEKHQGRKDSAANQASRGSRALLGILFSSSPLGEKPLSVILLLVFLPSLRADIRFPKSQAGSAPAPHRPGCSLGGEKEGGGGAMPCAPTGTPVPGDQQ